MMMNNTVIGTTTKVERTNCELQKDTLQTTKGCTAKYVQKYTLQTTKGLEDFIQLTLRT